MLLIDFKQSNIKVLRDLVAFKWIKEDKFSGTNFIVPDKVYDEGGEGRLGNTYTGEVIAIGPDVKNIKPGMRFVIHEYDKAEQGEPWNDKHVIFCEEGVMQASIRSDKVVTSMAGEITDKMVDDYETY